MTRSALLSQWISDARRRTFELTADLSGAALLGPRLAIVNPPLWEIGHIAWFQEHWVLRRALGRAPLHADADALFDSAKVAHDTRWDLPLWSLEETHDYLIAVRDAVLDRLAGGDVGDELAYFVALSVFHEDMHGEALLYTRQTLSYPAPALSGSSHTPVPTGAAEGGGDASISGGALTLGARPGEDPFVFDNEKWAHDVEVAPFRIARTAVTEGAFAEFVHDGGYRRDELWTDDGRRWRNAAAAELPAYWRARGASFERRVFDRWLPLEPDRAMMHVSAHEAEAWCRWAGRRLPTEAEWELVASGAATPAPKRRFPWGDAQPTPGSANLDAARLGPVTVGAFEAGDSVAGCRQLIGNVWEWTATTFEPYPGFVEDPYKEYSAPWFGDHRVLRGGCFATRARLLRNTWRNFYTPDRRDVFAGFRTCAID